MEHHKSISGGLGPSWLGPAGGGGHPSVVQKLGGPLGNAAKAEAREVISDRAGKDGGKS